MWWPEYGFPSPVANWEILHKSKQSVKYVTGLERKDVVAGAAAWGWGRSLERCESSRPTFIMQEPTAQKWAPTTVPHGWTPCYAQRRQTEAPHLWGHFCSAGCPGLLKYPLPWETTDHTRTHLSMRWKLTDMTERRVSISRTWQNRSMFEMIKE